MKYRFCGKSGLQLPVISLGLWHNFGDVDNFTVARDMTLYAFEHGITHFDLADNYGPPPGSAEINFGKILSNDLKNHRDEMLISSKAGHLMWEGVYGDGGSRKHLMASIHQSLKRTGLEYFDIFYSHRYDPQTPLAETVQTLIDIVRQGKALYIGLSKYPAEQAKQACQMMAAQNVPCLVFQDRYHLFNRDPETQVFPTAEKYGAGFVAFSPLAQGLLTDKYLAGIPDTSRAAKNRFLKREQITEDMVKRITCLNRLAWQRGRSLAETALTWVLQHKQVTSVIVGASSVAQLQDNLKAADGKELTPEEINLIEQILKIRD
ncbi:MAG: aldo/keto reductase [Prevotellaceae bacterium]|jgi:L-glyceraldehyde 3-phosphate reductase|nr:aldo/keto reductase [Prevotellaceae bacterium]